MAENDHIPSSKSLLDDEDELRLGRGGGGARDKGNGYGWSLSGSGSRQAMYQNTPEAVLKVTGYTRFGQDAIRSLAYYTRDHSLIFHTTEGNELHTAEEQTEYLRKLPIDFTKRFDPERAIRLVVTRPEEMPEKAFRSVIKTWAKNENRIKRWGFRQDRNRFVVAIELKKLWSDQSIFESDFESMKQALGDQLSAAGHQPGENFMYQTKRLPRQAIAFVISSPDGTEADQLKSVVDQFMAITFRGEYGGGFTLHTDTENPHAHVYLATRNLATGLRLRTNPKILKAWRECLAECFHDHGIRISATQRFERGLPAPDKSEVNSAVYFKQQRGEIPESEYRAFSRALDDYLDGNWEPTVYEKQLAEQTKHSKQAALKDAARLRAEAKSRPDQNESLNKQADDAERFAKMLKPQQTRRQFYMSQIAHSLDPIKARRLLPKTETQEGLKFIRSVYLALKEKSANSLSRKAVNRLVTLTYRVSGESPPEDYGSNRDSALRYVLAYGSAVEKYYANPGHDAGWLQEIKARHMGQLPPSKKMKNFIRLLARRKGVRYQEADLSTKEAAQAFINKHTNKQRDAGQERSQTPSRER